MLKLLDKALGKLIPIMGGAMLAMLLSIAYLSYKNGNLIEDVTSLERDIRILQTTLEECQNKSKADLSGCFEYQQKYQELDKTFDELLGMYDELLNQQTTDYVYRLQIKEPSGDANHETTVDPTHRVEYNAARRVLCQAGLAEAHLCSNP